MGTDRQIDQFLEVMNAKHKDIKFTVEKGNKTINNLDLTLTIRDYKIHRKPTHHTIKPEDTFHHYPKNKLAAMENYDHQAMTILKDEEERTKEIQVVGQIVKANGY